MKIKDYEESLYKLAAEGKFDSHTTPINYDDVKQNLDYEKLVNPPLLARSNKAFVKGLLWLVSPIVNGLCFSMRIKGRKNLKGIKRGITISNHISYFDCLWLTQILKNKKFYITVGSYNFKKGVLGVILRAAGELPLPPSSAGIREFGKRIKQILDKNMIVHFYPEQSLWKYYKQSRPLKRGAFHYAVDNDAPIIPIIYLVRGGKRITAQICKPEYPNKDLPRAEQIAELNERVQKVYDKTIIDFYGYDEQTYSMFNKNEGRKKKKVEEKK